MNKSDRTRGKMTDHFCIDVKSEKGKIQLKDSVEHIIKKNKKVFDKLAKS